MKKIFFSILFFTTAIFHLHAQQTINDANAEKRNVSGYHGIEVATGIKLILTQGDAEAVAVSAATTEFRDKIVTEVINGILKIHYDSKLGAINKKKQSKDMKAYVSVRTIKKLDVSTGAEVEIIGILKSTNLKMNLSTGAFAKGVIDVSELEIKQNTGAEIQFSGTASKLDVEGDTGSMFKGSDLKTNTCNVKVSTGAGVYISVEKELNIKANTGGYVKYKGDAAIRDIKTNTGGVVSRS